MIFQVGLIWPTCKQVLTALIATTTSSYQPALQSLKDSAFLGRASRFNLYSLSFSSMNFLRNMSSDYNFFQHYFTTYRKTLPKRSLTAPFNLWKRSNSTRNSIKSVSEVFLRDMDPPSSLSPTNGSLNHQEPEPTSAFDSEIFRSYLLSLLPPVIGALPSDIESLFDEEFDARVARFASDTGGVIYVVKVKEESEGMSLFHSFI